MIGTRSEQGEAAKCGGGRRCKRGGLPARNHVCGPFAFQGLGLRPLAGTLYPYSVNMVAEAEVVAQVQKRFQVMLVGWAEPRPCTNALRCGDRSPGGGQSPTTTDPTPPRTASAASGSRRG